MPTLPLPSLLTSELPALGSLKEFSHTERAILFLSGEVLQHAAGDRVIDESEAQTHLHFLIDGRMEVFRKGSFVAELFPGHLFGERAVLHPPHASSSVVSAEDSVTWRIHRDALRLLMEEHAETGAKLMRAMTKAFGERL